jgi:hypothetical protein
MHPQCEVSSTYSNKYLMVAIIYLVLGWPEEQ